MRQRYAREGIPVYNVEDLKGEAIEGTFYEAELQKITFDPEGEFRVEKELKRRQRPGHPPEVIVKWYSWPSKFNSWIPEEDVTTYN